MRKLTVGLAALTVVAMGCDDNRTSTLSPVGAISIGAPIGPSGVRVPSASVTVGASATVTTSDLRAVTGAAYHFWYVSTDPVTAAAVYTPAFGSVVEFFNRDSLSAGGSGTPVPDPLTGDIIQVVDSTVVSTANVGTYAGTDSPAVDSVRLALDSAADVGLVAPAVGRNAVVVSLGAGTTADAMFLFRRTGVVGGGTMTFGNFGGPDVISGSNPADYVYTLGGGGIMNFRGTELSADFRELRRPPQGFYYAGYVLNAAGVAVMVDTLRSAYNALADLSRVSLFDADVDGQLPGIAVTAITNSQVRNCVTGVATCANTMALPATSTFAGQLRFVLTLSPKGAASTLGVTEILAGDIPDRVVAN